jgi:hypothetical protein
MNDLPVIPISAETLLHVLSPPTLFLSATGSILQTSKSIQLSPSVKGSDIRFTTDATRHIDHLEICLLPSTRSVYRNWTALLSGLTAAAPLHARTQDQFQPNNRDWEC